MFGAGARPPAGLISFAEQLLSKQDSLGRLIAVARRRLKQTVGRRGAGPGLSSQQFWGLVYLLEAAGAPPPCALCGAPRLGPPPPSRVLAPPPPPGFVRPAARPPPPPR